MSRRLDKQLVLCRNSRCNFSLPGILAGDATLLADGSRELPKTAFRRPLCRIVREPFAELKPKPFD